jgi:hypothetical protein
MCNDEDGEHIQLIVRIKNGQFIRSVTFENDVKAADDFFDKYEKEHAKEFIVEFEKALDEQRQADEALQYETKKQTLKN